VGLPEAVGFALGAGAMAKALVLLETNLAGKETVRRVFRDGGVIAELERAAADHGWRLPPEWPAAIGIPRQRDVQTADAQTVTGSPATAARRGR
jgi:hypothetical protein